MLIHFFCLCCYVTNSDATLPFLKSILLRRYSRLDSTYSLTSRFPELSLFFKSRSVLASGIFSPQSLQLQAPLMVTNNNSDVPLDATTAAVNAAKLANNCRMEWPSTGSDDEHSSEDERSDVDDNDNDEDDHNDDDDDANDKVTSKGDRGESKRSRGMTQDDDDLKRDVSVSFSKSATRDSYGLLGGRQRIHQCRAVHDASSSQTQTVTIDNLVQLRTALDMPSIAPTSFDPFSNEIVRVHRKDKKGQPKNLEIIDIEDVDWIEAYFGRAMHSLPEDRAVTCPFITKVDDIGWGDPFAESDRLLSCFGLLPPLYFAAYNAIEHRNVYSPIHGKDLGCFLHDTTVKAASSRTISKSATEDDGTGRTSTHLLVITWLVNLIRSPLSYQMRHYYFDTFISPREIPVCQPTDVNGHVVAYCLARNCPVLDSRVRLLRNQDHEHPNLASIIERKDDKYGMHIVSSDTLEKMRELGLTFERLDKADAYQNGNIDNSELFHEIIERFSDTSHFIYVQGLATIDNSLLKWLAEYTVSLPSIVYCQFVFNLLWLFHHL
jgi:hypothetical protein